MNINLLSLSNNKKSSHICVKYGSEDVYTAGKSANCDLTPNWAQFISVAGQRLYTIQRRRQISASLCSKFRCFGGVVNMPFPYQNQRQRLFYLSESLLFYYYRPTVYKVYPLYNNLYILM